MSGFTVPGTFLSLLQTLLNTALIIMKKYFISHHIWLLPALILVDALFFGFTNPANVNSVLLIVGYLLIVATIYSAFQLVARIATLYGVSKRPALRIANLFTIITAILLALSSVGELTTRDVVVILPLSLILYAYFFYAKKNSKS